MLAKHIDGASVVSLRAPPPLDTALSLDTGGDRVELRDGDALLAEARPAALDLAAPAAPSLAEARAAERRYVGLTDHRYGTCFTCGPARANKDGLALFTGHVEGRGMVACAWVPAADLADEQGFVREEFLHAALDCPSYWALPRAGTMAALLARMTSVVAAERPRAGETLIVAAWPLASEGRKHSGASAIYAADGRVIARADALWIEPKAA